MSRVSRRTAVIIGFVPIVLIALFLLRPLWHWFAMFLWTAPIVWFPPAMLLVAAGVVLRRSPEGRLAMRTGSWPPGRLLVLPALAFVVFLALSLVHGALVGRAIVEATRYESIPGLPSGGQVRLVPREVAEQNAASAFNSPTETLTDFRIVNTEKGMRWTALRTPQGLFRTFTRKSQGLVELDAEQTARSLREVDAEFEVAPRLQVLDGLRWRLLRRRFLVHLQDPVAVDTARGPRIVVPYLTYKGFPVRRPVLGGVYVVAPDGTIEDLSPKEAARRTELARSGRASPTRSPGGSTTRTATTAASGTRGSSTRARPRSATPSRTGSRTSSTSAGRSARSG